MTLAHPDAALAATSDQARPPSVHAQFWHDHRALCMALAVTLAAGVCSVLWWDQPPRLLCFVWAYLALVGAYFGLSDRQGSWRLSHPAAGLFGLLFLYALASALFVERNLSTFYGERLIEDVHWRYYAACWCGALGLALGLMGGGGTGNPSDPITQWDAAARATNKRVNSSMWWCTGIVLVIFLPWVLDKLNFLSVRSYREGALALRLERLADESAGITEVLTQYLPVTLLLVVCVQQLFEAKRAVWIRLAAGAVLCAYFATGFLQGERYTVLFVVILAIVYRDIWLKPLPWHWLAVGGIAAYLLMNLMPIVRYSASPALMWQVFLDVVQKDGFREFSLGQSNELLTATNLYRQIQGLLLGESTFNLGAWFFTDLMVYVPRPLFPGERPLPTSERFVEVFYPGVRDIGGGYGFFIVQEGYWAFGLIGCILYMALFGFAVAHIYRWVMRWRHLELAVFAYAAVYADLVMASIRSGFVGSIKAALLHAFPFALVLLVHGLWQRWRASRG